MHCQCEGIGEVASGPSQPTYKQTLQVLSQSKANDCTCLSLSSPNKSMSNWFQCRATIMDLPATYMYLVSKSNQFIYRPAAGYLHHLPNNYCKPCGVVIYTKPKLFVHAPGWPDLTGFFNKAESVHPQQKYLWSAQISRVYDLFLLLLHVDSDALKRILQSQHPAFKLLSPPCIHSVIPVRTSTTS